MDVSHYPPEIPNGCDRVEPYFTKIVIHGGPVLPDKNPIAATKAEGVFHAHMISTTELVLNPNFSSSGV